MTHLSRIVFSAAGVIFTGMVGCIGKSGAVGLRAGNNVVLVGLVPGAVNRFIFLSERYGSAQIITESSKRFATVNIAT